MVISIVIVMAIVLGVVGKMTYDTLEERAQAEKFNELGKIAASVQTRAMQKAYQASRALPRSRFSRSTGAARGAQP